jgi:hypothetical protein
LTGFIDQQPSDAARWQIAEHAFDGREGSGEDRHDHEQGRPEITEQFALRFVMRWSPGKDVHQNAKIVE